ncbi:MAG TPA: ribonuclease domain-containing protein [Burkholderiaceae bacterium]|nr:ribonuclease domain-containing protein [Burkholderiaceae bacterium]
MFRSGALRAPQAPVHLGLLAFRSVLSAAIASGALLAPAGVFAKGPIEQGATVALAELPREARATEIAIRSGGPFHYSKDGAVFGNRERRLPNKTRGYYREYTVPTPGAPDRGARRIVCGGHQPSAPDACYYTADHYTSFRRIVD